MQSKSLKDLPVDVIMPVFSTDQETVDLTERAIKSLNADRLILIDNASTVGGGQLRQWADVYIRNKENLGYAKAVNQGLQIASRKWFDISSIFKGLGIDPIVAIANNDIRVSPNWKEVATDILKSGSHIGSVHFRMIPYGQSFNPGIDVWPTGRERWCSSSFFVMRNIQYYDEGFLNSLDDWDYWRRFRELGHKTAYTNKAEYQHLDSWTQQKIGTRSENDKKNLEYYVQKWGETPDEWMARMYPEQLSQPWKPFP